MYGGTKQKISCKKKLFQEKALGCVTMGEIEAYQQEGRKEKKEEIRMLM